MSREASILKSTAHKLEAIGYGPVAVQLREVLTTLLDLQDTKRKAEDLYAKLTGKEALLNIRELQAKTAEVDSLRAEVVAWKRDSETLRVNLRAARQLATDNAEERDHFRGCAREWEESQAEFAAENKVLRCKLDNRDLEIKNLKAEVPQLRRQVEVLEAETRSHYLARRVRYLEAREVELRSQLRKAESMVKYDDKAHTIEKLEQRVRQYQVLVGDFTRKAQDLL